MNKIIEVEKYKDSDITSIEIPDGIEIIEESAFENCKNLEYVILPDSIRIIGKCAFKNCCNLKEIVMSETLLIISEEAFENCSLLKKIDLPNNLQVIGDGAFMDCDSLKEIVIPESVTKIGNGLFRSCYGLKSVIFEGNDTEIGHSSFSNCKDLEYVKLPSNIIAIRSFTFYSCHSLTQIDIPESVSEIDSEAFEESGLESIDLSNTKIKSIYSYAFNKCHILNSVKLPNSLVKIGEGAFSETSLKTIDLPDSLTEIGTNAFSQCSHLEEIKIPSNCVSLGGGAFSHCKKLQRVSLPNIRILPSCIFYFCEELKSVILPSTLEEIERKAFSFSGLTDIKLSSNLHNLGDKVFWNTDIKNIFIPGDNISRVGDDFISGKVQKIEFGNGLRKVNFNFNKEQDSLRNLKTIIFPKTTRVFSNTLFSDNTLYDVDIILNTSLFFVYAKSLIDYFKVPELTINGVKVKLSNKNRYAESVILPKLQREEIRKIVEEKLIEKHILYSKKDVQKLSNKLIRIILFDSKTNIRSYNNFWEHTNDAFEKIKNAFKIDNVIDKTINEYIDSLKLVINSKELKLLPKMHLEDKTKEEILLGLSSYLVNFVDVNDIGNYGNDLTIYAGYIANSYAKLTNKILSSDEEINVFNKYIMNDTVGINKFLKKQTSMSYEEINNFIENKIVNTNDELTEFMVIEKMFNLYLKNLDLIVKYLCSYNTDKLSSDLKVAFKNKLDNLKTNVIMMSQEQRKVIIIKEKHYDLYNKLLQIKREILPELLLTIANSMTIDNSKNRVVVIQKISNILNTKKENSIISNESLILPEMNPEFQKEFKKML